MIKSRREVRWFTLLLLVVLGMAGALALGSHDTAASRCLSSSLRYTTEHAVMRPNKVNRAYGEVPLSFEANQGQTASQVKFLSRSSSYTIFLTSTEAVLVLRKPVPLKAQHKPEAVQKSAAVLTSTSKRAVLRMKLVRANPAPRVVVTKLNTTGSGLVYSTYVGDLAAQVGYAIAINSGGEAYITGYDTGPYDPVTMMGFGTSRPFVTKLNASGSALNYFVRLGTGDYSDGRGIAVDNVTGNAFVTGVFKADSTMTPTWEDAFVAKLDSGGSTLFYSMLGGSNHDGGLAIALDGSANAYVTGYTFSTNFPTTAGAFSTSNAGGEDGFVTKLN